MEYLINCFVCRRLITSDNAETPEVPWEAQRMISLTIPLDKLEKKFDELWSREAESRVRSRGTDNSNYVFDR